MKIYSGKAKRYAPIYKCYIVKLLFSFPSAVNCVAITIKDVVVDSLTLMAQSSLTMN